MLDGAGSRADDPRAPICFTNELVAFTNGLAVTTAFKTAEAISQAHVDSLIGSRVLFDGNSWDAPRGTNADLNLGGGLLLCVELEPQHDVRPHGGLWRAEVVGVLRSIDFEKRVIHVKARPEDWKAYLIR
jgi:hypothetical protein